MRTMGLLLVVGVLAAPAWSGDIYSWVDESGAVHYSNTPTASAASVNVVHEEAVPVAAAPAAQADAHDDADGFSTRVSLQRTAIERSMRDTERALAEIDARLGGLGRARTAHARGTAATGGVGTNAAAAESEEERALVAQRKELTDRLAALQADYAKLRTEVATRLGGTPDWWVEFRPGRR